MRGKLSKMLLGLALVGLLMVGTGCKYRRGGVPYYEESSSYFFGFDIGGFGDYFYDDYYYDDGYGGGYYEEDYYEEYYDEGYYYDDGFFFKGKKAGKPK